MSKETTITINGVRYNAHSGMRLDETPNAAVRQKHAAPSAHAMHQASDRTHTLNRSHVKAPASHIAAKQKPARQSTNRSPIIKKFADVTPVAKSLAKPTSTPDIAPVKHPIQAKVTQQSVTKPQPKPAQEIKHQAIEKALQSAKPAKEKVKKRSFFKSRPRTLSVIAGGVVVVLLAAYLTYINLPSLSVRVAGIQSGIAATYPSYQPSGYSLHGPVAFSDGQVHMTFNANAGSQSYTINQTKSSWDSSALLDNYVTQASKGDYTTFDDSGLTIYVYDTDAAWVNGGILHTIQGDAPLTSEQIRRIATSM